MDRARFERHLRQAEEHVALGLQHIADQRAIVAEHEQKGWDATRARELLATFESIQTSHEADRDRLRREIAALGKRSG
jgi:hypothetical protein